MEGKNLTHTYVLQPTSEWHLGDAKNHNTLREEAFVYFFRFWIRALLGDFVAAKKVESTIFGSTSQRSQVNLILNYGCNRGAVDFKDEAKLNVELTLIYQTERAKEEFHNLLTAILRTGSYIGGVGGKTVRGFGSFKLFEEDYNQKESKLDKIEKAINDSLACLDLVSSEVNTQSIRVTREIDSLILTGQRDLRRKYPFLIKVKVINLIKKDINDAFSEQNQGRGKKAILIGGRKYDILNSVFPNEEPNSLKNLFGSLNPRYQSPIAASRWNKQVAIFSLFQPSIRGGQLYSTENMIKVFDETCNTYA